MKDAVKNAGADSSDFDLLKTHMEAKDKAIKQVRFEPKFFLLYINFDLIDFDFSIV